MNDIFVSYANPDRHVAQQLADALEALGWSVWWDREIPLGRAFDQVIEEELNAARCVIVLWTAESARSRWVKTEAAAAADRERLLPVLLEDVPIPLEFRRIQTAMLQGWAGDQNHPEFVRLIDSVRRMLGQPEAPQPVATDKRPRASARAWRWRLKVAAGVAVVVLALLAILIGRTSFRSSEPTPSQPGGAGTPQQGPSASAGAAVPTGSSAPTAAASSSASAAAVKGSFPIRIGDRIDNGVPGPGGGNIESAGAKDIYTFAAAGGQRVYFRLLKHSKDMERIEWRLADPDGAAVFETRLGYSEPGVQVLRKAGTYVMTVGSDREPQVGAYTIAVGSDRESATGTYRLQLSNAPGG